MGPTKKRRCLVLADGYYEWLREGKDKKPYLYEIDGGKPFAMAGLWEWWPGPKGERATIRAGFFVLNRESINNGRYPDTSLTLRVDPGAS